jgi:hypothetical protein
MENIIKEKKKKFLIKILLVILIPPILCIVFGTVDYFRAINGKKPIFIYHTTNVSGFDVEVEVVVPEDSALPSEDGITVAGIGQNGIVFEDTTLPSKEGSTYYGIGYNVSTCDSETGNYTFQFGSKQKECYSTLTCTKTFAENDIQSFNYSFFDGKLYRLDTTITIPADQIANEETYKEKLIEINNVKGCGVTFVKQNDTTYVTMQICNIYNMSNSDVEKVYSVSKKSMEQTRDEIIDGYSHDKDMICE